MALHVARMPPTFALRALPAALALCAAGAAANPQGGVVQAGAATITSSGSRVDIVQSSQRAVIDWRSFSIGAGGHVNFRHPSAAGATLNRVTGPDASAILGRLTANGTVFLVNPNGILIGPGAKIDVGGLVATAANITNENFMAGRYKFDEVVNRNAVVVNRGEITVHSGGLVALVAPGVENSGVIRAELGRVVLASGNRFTLDPFGDKLIAFAIDDKVAARLTDVDGRPLAAYVNQAGTIEAGGGSVLLAAAAVKSVLDNVINTSGVVRATGFAQRGGEIVLHGGDEGVVRVAGTLDASGRASGATGGTVKVLGAEVVLDAGSRIDVAGDAGGGAAFVGGGVQGGGALPRSSRTIIADGASVTADAVTRGGGGTIVAWSDGETRFAGAFSARGGAAGGDGGFVEVSGKRELAFAGAVDAGAPAGKGGRLLLDPEVLVVDAATATGVANTLRGGTRVDLDATDTITVNQPIDGRGGASGAPLTLTAGNRIAVDNDIVTNDGEVSLKAGAGGIAMGRGPATSVTAGDGTIIHAGTARITLAATGDVAVQHLVTTGAVRLKSSAGNVTLHRDLGGVLGKGVGAFAATAAQGLRLKGVRATAEVTLATLQPDGSITLDGPIVARGTVTIGDPALAAQTTIRLRDDIHTLDGDIALNGRTLISPTVRGDNLIIAGGVPLFSVPDQALFDQVVLQVSLQTTGAGSIYFNGDVLWDGSSIPTARYLYNVPLPSPGFNWLDPVAAAGLRTTQPFRPVRHFGLNAGVEYGAVSFAGNVGTLDKDGVSTVTAAPKGSLGPVNTGNGLWVTITTLAGPDFVAFGSAARVEVPSFLIVDAMDPSLFLQASGPELFALSPPQALRLLPAANMPEIEALGGDPNLVGPSPRNVAEPGGFDRVATLPDVPLRPVAELQPLAPVAISVPSPTLPPTAGGGLVEARDPGSRTQSNGVVRDEAAAALGAAAQHAGVGPSARARGAGQGRSGGDQGLIRMSADAPATADAEYFSQEPFEFVETRSRRESR